MSKCSHSTHCVCRLISLLPRMDISSDRCDCVAASRAVMANFGQRTFFDGGSPDLLRALKLQLVRQISQCLGVSLCVLLNMFGLWCIFSCVGFVAHCISHRTYSWPLGLFLWCYKIQFPPSSSRYWRRLTLSRGEETNAGILIELQIVIVRCLSCRRAHGEWVAISFRDTYNRKRSCSSEVCLIYMQKWSVHYWMKGRPPSSQEIGVPISRPCLPFLPQ